MVDFFYCIYLFVYWLLETYEEHLELNFGSMRFYSPSLANKFLLD